MRRRAAAFAVFLLASAGLAGCLDAPAEPEEAPGGRSLAELRDGACPVEEPTDDDMVQLRMDVDVDPKHQDLAGSLGRYEDGYTLVQWNKRVHMNESLTKYGCIALEIPGGLSNASALAFVPSTGDPSCTWLDGKRIPVGSRTIRLTMLLMLACE